MTLSQPVPQLELPTKVDIGPSIASASGGVQIPTVQGGDYPINGMTGEKIPGMGAITEFQQSALNAHNKYRAVHSADPLVINKEMCAEAEAWASELAARGTLIHATTTDGENLAVNCKPKDRFTEMTGSEATDLWYKEVCEPGYVFNLGHVAGAGDFTQLVWRSTSDMCIGRAVGASGDSICTYVVARYRPAGNLLGSVRENVVKGQLHKESYCNVYGPSAEEKPWGVPGIAIGVPLHGANDMAPLQPPGGDDPGLGAASLNTKEFRLGALNAHNKFREVHEATPLALNAAMCLEAEEYATLLAQKSSLMRNSMTRDGESIAMACNNKDLEMTGDEATTKWYNEICNPGYDFKGNQPYGAAHFTQIVWKDTKLFGIGKATVRRNGLFCTYVVARYRPAGNTINLFREEVEMGRFDYGYCDTLGKGGGGKGMSSGVPSGKGIDQDRQWAASSLYNRDGIVEVGTKKANLMSTPIGNNTSKLYFTRLSPKIKSPQAENTSNDFMPRRHNAKNIKLPFSKARMKSQRRSGSRRVFNDTEQHHSNSIDLRSNLSLNKTFSNSTNISKGKEATIRSIKSHKSTVNNPTDIKYSHKLHSEARGANKLYSDFHYSRTRPFKRPAYSRTHVSGKDTNVPADLFKRVSKSHHGRHHHHHHHHHNSHHRGKENNLAKTRRRNLHSTKS